LKFLTARWIAVLTALIIASLGCQIIPQESSDPQSGDILLLDDFSDPESGWNRISNPTGETDYNDGVYRILVNEPNTDIWSKPGLKFGDTIIEVDAFKVGGGRDNRFGVICRASGTDSFYTFIISSDGYYGIGKVMNQNYELIGAEALLPSEAIQKGSANNRIRAECVEDTLRMFVNGEKVAEVRDAQFGIGDVGLIAGTYEEPDTDIRFDNFIVIQP
jgi:hypothetical protein